jgi:hypothetical protein
MKRHCWIQRNYKLYPNLYVVLTGPPGTGKGAAINPVLEVAKASGVVNLMTDRLTVPFIIERISKGFSSPVQNPGGGGTFVMDNSVLIATTELPVLLDNVKELKYLSDLWDSRETGYQYGTRGGGHLIIDKPNTHILGGVTPAGIAECLPQQSISSGFTSRIIFVYNEMRAKDIEWPTTPPPAQEIIEDLRHIAANVRGEFVFADEAKSLFEETYRASRADPDDEEFMSGFKSRMWVHIAKMSMIISAARTDDRIISKDDLMRAKKEVENVLKTMPTVFGRVGVGDLITAAQKVLSYIEKRGYASRGEITKALWRYFPHGAREDLTTILATFLDAGILIEVSQGGKIIYKVIPTSKP